MERIRKSAIANYKFFTTDKSSVDINADFQVLDTEGKPINNIKVKCYIKDKPWGKEKKIIYNINVEGYFSIITKAIQIRLKIEGTEVHPYKDFEKTYVFTDDPYFSVIADKKVKVKNIRTRDSSYDNPIKIVLRKDEKAIEEYKKIREEEEKYQEEKRKHREKMEKEEAKRKAEEQARWKKGKR